MPTRGAGRLRFMAALAAPLPGTTVRRTSLDYAGLRGRRFDPSSSPSASYFAPKTARAKDGLEIPQQRRAFLEYELYWRLATCSVFGVETAVFSRASYFVLLVQLK